MRFNFLFILLFLPAIVMSQNLQTLSSNQRVVLEGEIQGQPGIPECGTILITDELIEKAIENTRLLRPEVYDLMVKAKLDKSLVTSVSDTVGTLRDFFVVNIDQSPQNNWIFDVVTAELRAVGELSQVWVDTTELANEHVTQTEVDSLLEFLEIRTPSGSRDPSRGIIELDNEFFGPPPNIDGDGITDFLIVDIKDGFEPGGTFIAGFFFTNDQRFNNEGSNKRDLLYIDSFPGIFFNGRRSLGTVLSTLAHEYQHLIHHGFDPDETTFVNEGLSEMAEVICGFSLRSPTFYFNNTDMPLFMWEKDKLEHPSRAALFTLYYDEQLGDLALKKVVQESANGKAGISNVMNQLNVGFSFNDMFKSWSIANYLNNLKVDPRFGYFFPISGRPSAVFDHSDPNQNIQNQTVNPLAVDYIAYLAGDSLEITFNSPSSLDIKAIKLGPGVNQVEDVRVGAKYSLPDFGNTINKVIFAVINTNSSIATYSYNSQGNISGFLAEIAYDDGTPDPFSGNANFLTFGNNNQGFGWAVKFVPEVPNNKLVSAKIYAAFDQEFQGSSTPANAPKDFLFHVWNNRNGEPGNDIIGPFLVSTNRSAFTGDFLEVDLSAFEKLLTNLGTIYLGFTENDSIGTAVGMDSTTSENFTYAFFGPTHPNIPNQWRAMSDLTVKSSDGSSKPLAGWNMMMRATFEYLDTSVPSFTAGFFQNPIFSEQLDVFVVGSTKLNPDNLTATLTQGTDSTPLSLAPVPNTDGLVFVDDNVTLTKSGTINIHVSGTTKFGVSVGDTTFTFNVQLLQSIQGGLIASPNRFLEVMIPKNSLETDMYLIAMEGNSNIFNEDIENSLKNKFGSIYTVSPVGYQLKRPATVNIHLDSIQLGSTSPQDLAIVYWDSEKWVELVSTLASSATVISAQTNSLGHFALVKKGTITDVALQNSEVPTNFELYQNYPNPFNPSTIMKFDLPDNAHVVLKIYNLLGREIRTLLNSNRPAGSYQVTWDGLDNSGKQVSSGIYFYRLTAGNFSKTMKMVFTR
jgi:hypothetical protein